MDGNPNYFLILTGSIALLAGGLAWAILIVASHRRELAIRRKTENVLRESEEKYRSLVESIDDAVYLIDRNMRYRYANKKYLSRLGISSVELEGQEYEKFHPSEATRVFGHQIDQVIASGQPTVFEHQSHRDNRYFLRTLSPVLDPEDGGIKVITVSSKDITERKQAEDARERLTHDMGERIKELNCMYGVAAAIRKHDSLEKIFHEITALIPPSWQYPDITRAKIYFDGVEYVSKRFKETEWKLASDIMVNGKSRGAVEVFYLETRPEIHEGPFLEEERSLIDGVAQALDEAIEHKEAEETLRVSEVRFRISVENMLDSFGIYTAVRDDEGRIIDFLIEYVNKAACESNRMSREEQVGKYMCEILPGHRESGLFDEYCQVVETGKHLIKESLVYEDTYGEQQLSRAFDTRIVRLGDGFAAAWRDVTDRKQAEQELNKSRRDLSIRNQINQIMLTHSDEGMYSEILELILEVLGSEYGTFGYFEDDGTFTVPAATREIYWEKCDVSDKNLVFKKGMFSGIWSKAIKERKILFDNQGPFRMPKGHIQIKNTIVSPIVFEDKVISAIHVANKNTDYNERDRELLESITSHLAPVLHARLERDKQELVRKQVEDDIREAKEDYDRIIDNADEAIFKVDAKGGQVLYANSAAERIFGYTLEEWLANPTLGLEIIHPDFREKQRQVIAELNTKKEIMKNVVLGWFAKDGRVVFMDYTIIPIISEDGEVLYLESIGRDITERKQADEALKVSLQTAADLVHSTPYGLFIYQYEKPNRLILLSGNPEAERLTGIKIDDWIGKENNEIWPEAMKAGVTDAYLKVMETGKTYETEDLYYKDEKLEGAFRIRAFLLPEEKLCVSFENITERKLAGEKISKSQEQLRRLSTHLQSIREEERTEIAREIHDELGQHLTALIMDLSWVKNKLRRDQDPLKIKAGAMSELINSMIQTVKKLSARLRPAILDDLGIVAALEWEADEFCQHSDISCQLNFEPEEITLEPERSTTIYRIFQEALTNIIRHAKATSVTASLKKVPAGIHLEIVDNGIGITDEQTAGPKSFGLIGMRERVMQFGGEAVIEGQAGIGTRIAVYIPVG